MNSAKRGFTLIEIVMAMLFLSLGIMGVVALFFLGVNNSIVSNKHTMASIIAEDVRSGLFNALKFPIYIPNPSDPTLNRVVYRFELPSSIEGDGSSLINDTDVLNGFYFEVNDTPAQMYNASSAIYDFNNVAFSLDQRILDLPYEAFRKTGTTFTGVQELKREVWNYRQNPFYVTNSDYDEDDSHFYSFRILVRRSISQPSSGQLSPGEMLSATVYIFKQYVDNVIKLENYDTKFGLAKFETTAGQEMNECKPILTYSFYLPAN